MANAGQWRGGLRNPGQTRFVFLVPVNWFLVRRKDVVKAMMKIAGHFYDQSSKAVCRLLSLVQRLLRLDRRVSAVSNIFFVGFTAFVLVDMPTVKHARCKF